MNRRLKKYAEKQLLQYRNVEFLKELKGRVRKKKKQHNFFNKKFVAAGVAFVTITVVILCIFLIKPAMNGDFNYQDKPTTPAKEYRGENQKVLNSNLREVNEALDYLSFATGDSIQKCIDKEYGDTLYYSIIYTDDDELSMFDFKICVNPDYKMMGFDKEYTQNGTVASYELQYKETASCEEGIYFFSEIAKITTECEIIFIEAEIVKFDANSNFIETLNEIIQAK